jgi:hypothetical protein
LWQHVEERFNLLPAVGSARREVRSTTCAPEIVKLCEFDSFRSGLFPPSHHAAALWRGRKPILVPFALDPPKLLLLDNARQGRRPGFLRFAAI